MGEAKGRCLSGFPSASASSPPTPTTPLFDHPIQAKNLHVGCDSPSHQWSCGVPEMGTVVPIVGTTHRPERVHLLPATQDPRTGRPRGSRRQPKLTCTPVK